MMFLKVLILWAAYSDHKDQTIVPGCRLEEV